MTPLATAYPAAHPEPVANATRLAHVVFARPDIHAAARFLCEFGLEILDCSADLLRAQCRDGGAPSYHVERGAPRFVGIGLEVGTEDALQRLAALPGASLLRADDGTARVRLWDPAGHRVDVCVRADACTVRPTRAPLTCNRSTAVARVNGGQRPEVAPPELLRLGHVALEVCRFREVVTWYTATLGLLPSDVLVFSDGTPAVVFLRLNLGDTPADHHTLALAQSFRDGLSHVAFEVVDVDALGMGQRVLAEAGYTHAWGIGRHLLGSQLFDYWCDPWGEHHEHYCDGDAFSAEVPMGVHPVSRAAMAQWGPAIPRRFTRPPVSKESALALARALRDNPELTPSMLLRLARLYG